MKEQRNNSLDFLRIICATIIIFCHYQQEFDVKFKTGINFYFGNFNWGFLVELFFIISGMLCLKYVYKICNGESTFPKFFFKKWIRFVPMLLLGAFLYELNLIIYKGAIGSPWHNENPSIWGFIIASLGIQRSWGIPDLKVNNPTWYVCVLLIIYIYFYLATKISSKLKLTPYISYVFLIFMGIIIQSFNVNVPFFDSFVARGLIGFFVGIILAKLIEKFPIKNIYSLICLLTVVSYILIFLFARFLLDDGFYYIFVFIVCPSIVIMVNAPILKKVFSFKAINELGKISFPTYILHIVVMQWFDFIRVKANWQVDLFNRWTMIIIALICWIVGAIAYFAYQKNIDKLMHRKIKFLTN